MTVGSVKFVLSADDAVRAAKLAAARALPVPMHYALIGGTLVAVFAYVVLQDRNSFAVNYMIPLLVALMVLAGILQYFIVPYKARQHFHQADLLRDEVTAEWDDRSFKLSGRRGATELDWTDFYRWSEDDAVFLLHHSEQMYHAIPKRVLTPEEQQNLVAAVTKSGLKKR